uniref:NADH-ubiquinone oxidoreductase chain 2 n=1 Tax=Limnoria quadripunctata TaxID=161573 RepID=A0A023IX87_LIMQU|nr:NADH dehydrogenase subunit 2 [Limnoria quadripunctata]
MMKIQLKFFLILTLLSGTYITLSSSSWLGVWMGLEMNMMSFVPFMITSKSSMEAGMKYFFIQSTTSLLLLFMSYSISVNYCVFVNLMMFVLMMKLGAAPFHFWLPMVVNSLEWNSIFFILTFQKIAPLGVFSYLVSWLSLNQIYLFVFISVWVGALGGWNELLISKLLSFSSVHHVGWILMTLKLGTKLWVSYLFVYSVILLSLIKVLGYWQVSHLKNLVLKCHTFTALLFISVSFMSLGGLPPFTGFFPKLMVLLSLSSLNYFFSMMILVMPSLLVLFFYLRVSIFVLLILKANSFLGFKDKSDMVNSAFFLFNVCGLFLWFLL